VLRCDLPFRQQRPYGPPRPGDAVRDREGLKHAAAAMRKLFSGRLFLGGQSYGGRQASMLVADGMGAEQKPLADGLLLLSYPLRPPSHPEKPRTQHLPKIEVPVMFVHGTHDPFGTLDEIESARKLISARTLLLPVEGAGHDLGFAGKKKCEDLPLLVLEKFQEFFS
jgi:predicted alpha/beta-hydrolase family hydrolase